MVEILAAVEGLTNYSTVVEIALGAAAQQRGASYSDLKGDYMKCWWHWYEHPTDPNRRADRIIAIGLCSRICGPNWSEKGRPVVILGALPPSPRNLTLSGQNSCFGSTTTDVHLCVIEQVLTIQPHRSVLALKM
jgi:hypothetical protein